MCDSDSCTGLEIRHDLTTPGSNSSLIIEQLILTLLLRFFKVVDDDRILIPDPLQVANFVPQLRQLCILHDSSRLRLRWLRLRQSR